MGEMERYSKASHMVGMLFIVICRLVVVGVVNFGGEVGGLGLATPLAIAASYRECLSPIHTTSTS